MRRRGEPRGSGAARRQSLDQRRENRDFLPAVEHLADGEAVLTPLRSGGPHDPLGTRPEDLSRADKLVAAVEGHPGRWLLLTLTIDRKLFLSEHAGYLRCQERVREVADGLATTGIYATGLELQTKTGEGWPHWHLVLFVPDDRSLDELKAVAKRRWRIRTEHVDAQTGEVTVSREKIGFFDLQEARTRQGVARYAAKYLIKPWPAIPEWLGRSKLQLRKLRLSSRMYDWLEAAGLHQRQRGSRRVSQVRRRPARSLWERMARSGASHLAFVRQDGKLRYLGAIPVPSCAEGAAMVAAAGGEVIRLGGWGSVRWRVTPETWQRLKARAGEAAELQRRIVERRLAELAAAWEEHQRRRREAEWSGSGSMRLT